MAQVRQTRKRKGHSKKPTGTPSKSVNMRTDYSPMPTEKANSYFKRHKVKILSNFAREISKRRSSIQWINIFRVGPRASIKINAQLISKLVELLIGFLSVSVTVDAAGRRLVRFDETLSEWYKILFLQDFTLKEKTRPDPDTKIPMSKSKGSHNFFTKHMKAGTKVNLTELPKQPVIDRVTRMEEQLETKFKRKKRYVEQLEAIFKKIGKPMIDIDRDSTDIADEMELVSLFKSHIVVPVHALFVKLFKGSPRFGSESERPTIRELDADLTDIALPSNSRVDPDIIVAALDNDIIITEIKLPRFFHRTGSASSLSIGNLQNTEAGNGVLKQIVSYMLRSSKDFVILSDIETTCLLVLKDVEELEELNENEEAIPIINLQYYLLHNFHFGTQIPPNNMIESRTLLAALTCYPSNFDRQKSNEYFKSIWKMIKKKDSKSEESDQEEPDKVATTIQSLEDDKKNSINHAILKKGNEEDGLADVIVTKFKTYKKFFHKDCNEKFDSNKNIVIKIYTDKNLEYEYSINPTAQLEGPSELRCVNKFKKFVKDFIFEPEVRINQKIKNWNQEISDTTQVINTPYFIGSGRIKDNKMFSGHFLAFSWVKHHAVKTKEEWTLVRKEVEKLHKAKIAHHDITLENTGIDETGRAFLLDFDDSISSANTRQMNGDFENLEQIERYYKFN